MNSVDNYWDERAESYSKQNISQLDRKEKWKSVLNKYMPEGKNAKILDIGTGPGFLAILMAKEGYNVSAVDRSGQMIYHAVQNAQQENVNVDFKVVGDEMPFEEDSFDMILSRDVVWMQKEPEKTLESWYKLLKKGGTMVYFDADWYGYLRDDESIKGYKEHRKNVEKNNGFVYTKANEMEQMAHDFPLTYQARPQWDVDFWNKQQTDGVLCETELNSSIYSKLEQLQYEKNQEFLICVKK